MATPTPKFEHEVVDDQINDGYWIQAADIDGDGRPDLVTSGWDPGRSTGIRTLVGISA